MWCVGNSDAPSESPVGQFLLGFARERPRDCAGGASLWGLHDRVLLCTRARETRKSATRIKLHADSDKFPFRTLSNSVQQEHAWGFTQFGRPQEHKPFDTDSFTKHRQERCCAAHRTEILWDASETGVMRIQADSAVSSVQSAHPRGGGTAARLFPMRIAPLMSGFGGFKCSLSR